MGFLSIVRLPSVLFSFLGFFFFPIVTNCESVIVNTTVGLISGSITYNGRVREFLSIPYATPPINDLRWTNPIPHKGWNDNNTIFNATTPPWGCPQTCGGDIPGICPVIKKEDCLILSVFTPNKIDPNTLYPIMVYFHGGGWMENYGGGVRLNASAVVNFTQSVIIVLVNYRLGALGMLYDKDLNLRGNFGHFDQLLSIEWVYNNSLSFGGDKNNIIMYGESAGANSGLLHLIQNNTLNYKTYIKGIIMESPFTGQRWRTDDEWEEMDIQFSRLLGCNMSLTNDARLECLKSKKAEEIVSVQNIVSDAPNSMIKWSMSLKNDLFYDQPLISIRDNIFRKNISIIGGLNKCEICISFNLNAKQNSLEFYDYWIPKYGETVVNNMINFYNVPINTSDNLVNYTIKIQTDSYNICPTRNVLKYLTKYNNNNIISNNISYRFYRFMYASYHINSKIYNNDRCWNSVCHTEELWYVFNDDLTHLINDTWNKDEIILRNEFLSYWTNFASSGNNPNNGKNSNYLSVNWDKFTFNNTDTILLDIGDNMKMVKNFDDYVCNFWDSQNYTWLIPVY